MSMKANELTSRDLMIEDWVRVISAKPNTYRLPFYQIITAEKMMMIRNGRMVVEPIPLTPEILEKNGFEKNTYHYEFETTNEIGIEQSVRLTRWESNPGYCCKMDSFPQQMRLSISSVHQLQHALKIIGIKKEIMP